MSKFLPLVTILISLSVTVQALAGSDSAACPSLEPLTIQGGHPAEQKKRFRQAYDATQCLRLAAAAAGFEWLETEKLLQQALREAGEGRWETATELVRKANFQAERALQQAEYEREAWKQRVVD